LNYITEYPASAVFYILVLLFSTSLALWANNTGSRYKKIPMVLIISILSLCAGFRGITVGRDTPAYMRAIERWGYGYSGGLARDMEPGLSMLVKFLLNLVDSPQFVLVVIAVIINGLIICRLWSLRDKISFPFAVFCYTTVYYLITYSGIRQWIAVAIVFYASKYVLEQKYGKFLLFILLAGMFHNTAFIALLYIPFNLLLLRRFPRKYKYVYMFILLFSPIFAVGLYVLISQTGLISQYSTMLNEENQRFNIGLSIFFRAAIVLFATLFIKTKNYELESGFFPKEVTLVYFFGLILAFSGYFYANIARIGWYFIIFEVVFFSMIIKTKKYGKLFKYPITLFVLYIFYTSLKATAVMPYIPFWKN
jgi:hypothetical protein